MRFGFDPGGGAWVGVAAGGNGPRTTYEASGLKRAVGVRYTIKGRATYLQ